MQFNFVVSDRIKYEEFDKINKSPVPAGIRMKLQIIASIDKTREFNQYK